MKDIPLRSPATDAGGDLIWLEPWHIFICRPCAVAVRRANLDTHFRRRHTYNTDQLRTVQEAADRRTTLEPRLPKVLRKAIPHLAVQDGVRCLQTIDRTKCHYICTKPRDMREHCRKVHGWTQHDRRGRPSAPAPREEPWDAVRCQRVFTMGPGSHFVQVSTGSSRTQDDVVRLESSVWDTVSQRVQTVRRTQEDRIEEGREKGSSAWLRRAGWVKYLSGMTRTALLALVSVSARDTDEQVVAATVRSLVSKSEWLLRNRCSNSVKVLLTQLNPGENRVQHLQGYLEDQDRLQSVRSWQAILLFFLRTRQASSDDDTPKFTLLPRQRQCLERIVRPNNGVTSDDPTSDSNDELTSLESACLDFFISLLEQRVDSYEYQSPLVCALAVLGVHPGHEGWKGPDRYPSMLSGVIKLARFFVLRQAYEDSPKNDRAYGPSITIVETLVRRFMIRGTHGPVQWMIDLRSYGMSIAFNTATEEKVLWQGDRALYGQIQFTIPEFRTAIHRLTADTFAILRGQLLFGDDLKGELPSIPWDTLCDDHANSIVGWSFLKDTRTALSQDVAGTFWLVDRIRRSDELRARFESPRTPEHLRGPAVKAYLRQVRDFLVRLAVLFQLSAQPARVPELLTVRTRNSAQGDPRGILIDDGMVAFVTRYYKGAHRKGDTRLIHRYLPRTVGAMVVYYLWLVLPWVDTLEVVHYDSITLSDHLWPDEDSHASVRADHLRTMFPRVMQQYLGVDIGVQDYRHLAISIARRFRVPLEQGLAEQDLLGAYDGELDDDSIWDRQAAHTTHTAELVYGRTLGQLPGERVSRREEFRRISVQWHHFLGFPPTQSPLASYEQVDQSTLLVQTQLRRRWRQLRTSNPTTQLQVLYGRQARFRHNQEEVLAAIHAGHSPILAVLPTGGGKSLLFTLPASYEFSRVTVVVVPLLALREDLVRRSQEIQLRACVWKSGVEISSDYQLVFVTVEAAVTDEFLNVLHYLRTTGGLDRVVIDECHLLVIEHECEFRPAFTRLYRLAMLEVPLLCLTATLPVQDESSLWSRLKIGDVRGFTYRVSSRLSTHRFIVRITTIGQAASTIQSLVSDGRKCGRTIVYCPTVATVKDIARQVSNSLVYYADFPHKALSMQSFIQQPYGIIVCTQALGLGVHVDDVRTIIHTAPPDTLLQYVQECGRGGRVNGLHVVRGQERSLSGPEVGSSSPTPSVKCTMLYDRHTGPYRPYDTWIYRFLECEPLQVCRRQLLGQYLDGEIDPRPCQVQDGEQPCDICEPDRTTAVIVDHCRTDALSFPPSLSTTSAVPLVRPRSSARSRPPAALACRSSVETSAVSRTYTRSASPDPDFEQYQRQGRYVRRTVTHTLTTDATDTESYVHWLNENAVRCFLCLGRDPLQPAHTPEQCDSPERPSYDQIVKSFRGPGMAYASYSACFRCGLPQKFCERWEKTDLGWHRRPTTECQASRVIHEAGASLFFFSDDARYTAFIGRIGANIVRVGELPSLSARTTLCQKVHWNGFECTRLFREIFEWFRTRYSIIEPS